MSRTDPKSLLELTDRGARPSWNPDPDPIEGRDGVALMTPQRPLGNGTVATPSSVGVDGFVEDIFFGLLLCGLGIGLAFVTATVAALPGIAEHEQGLASGVSNTALQIGSALGVAIAPPLQSPAPITTWWRTPRHARLSCSLRAINPRSRHWLYYSSANRVKPGRPTRSRRRRLRRDPAPTRRMQNANCERLLSLASDARCGRPAVALAPSGRAAALRAKQPSPPTPPT